MIGPFADLQLPVSVCRNADIKIRVAASAM